MQVLERASGKGRREIELLVAELAPKPDVPSRMRKLPEVNPVRVMQAAALAAPTVLADQASFASDASVATRPCDASHTPVAVEMPSVAPAVSASRAAFALEAPRARASSTPLRPGRYKLELTAGQALHDKLEQLKNLMRHQVPDGDLAIIVERAVDLLLDKTVKQRFAQTRAPRKPRVIKRSRKANSRYIPRAVVREVYRRDSGQCTFVSPEGKRCCERGFIEFHHHDVPYGRGGEATVDNLRLACHFPTDCSPNAILEQEHMRLQLAARASSSCVRYASLRRCSSVRNEWSSLILLRRARAEEGLWQQQAKTRARPACGGRKPLSRQPPRTHHAPRARQEMATFPGCRARPTGPCSSARLAKYRRSIPNRCRP